MPILPRIILIMLKITKILLLQLFLLPLSVAQPFDRAPELPQRVRQIVEWQRSRLDGEPHKAAISRFDERGNLIEYTDFRDDDSVFSYTYDSQNRPLQCTEWIEGVEYQTTFQYRPDLHISERSFHDKTYRTCDYFRAGRLVEKKEFARGGELAANHLLWRWTRFHYDGQNRLLREQIDHYAVNGARKGEQLFTEIIRHHYDGRFLLYSQHFNAGESLRMVKYFRYDRQGRLLREIEHYPLEDRLDSTEYRYRGGKLWQRIEESENQRRVLVHVAGRPIRLRSYLDDELIGVVDYAYEYYR